jgi:hypothetical protein
MSQGQQPAARMSAKEDTDWGSILMSSISAADEEILLVSKERKGFRVTVEIAKAASPYFVGLLENSMLEAGKSQRSSIDLFARQHIRCITEIAYMSSLTQQNLFHTRQVSIHMVYRAPSMVKISFCNTIYIYVTRKPPGKFRRHIHGCTPGNRSSHARVHTELSVPRRNPGVQEAFTEGLIRAAKL